MLDKVMTGLNKSDLIVLAARPGMGKTAFALNMAVNVAKQGKKVAIFSLEMSKEQLVERLLSSEAFIPSDRMRKGMLAPDDWVNLAVVSQTISKMPIYLDDTAGITISEMKGKLRRLRDVSFVIIDYLQLMQSGANHSDNRVQEVSAMTRALKIMAKEFSIPVLVLSQLSRGPESRQDKRPMLSDLRESGSIEQDADLVLFLYRDSYYNEQSENPGIAECIVAKNRHGETSNVKLGWDGQYTKFRNVELARDEG
jgi:replicative DNA helicase